MSEAQALPDAGSEPDDLHDDPLRRYIGVVLRIYLRLRSDPDEWSRFLALTENSRTSRVKGESSRALSRKNQK